MGNLTLAQRAARYVGGEETPRTSVPIGPDTVMLVWRDGYMLVYSENSGRPVAVSGRLTANRHEKLLEALDRVDL